MREQDARLAGRVAERDAELDQVRADLAVLQRMLFGRSSKRSRPGPSGRDDADGSGMRTGSRCQLVKVPRSGPWIQQPVLAARVACCAWLRHVS
jgi:hypothetical protein